MCAKCASVKKYFYDDFGTFIKLNLLDMKGIYFLTFLLLTGCGSSQSLKTKSKDRKASDHLHQQLSHLEVQIIHLDSMITDARVRKDTTVIDQSIIDSEIFAYEVQKNALMSQKSQLQVMMNQ
jgi:hypothetical protein